MCLALLAPTVDRSTKPGAKERAHPPPVVGGFFRFVVYVLIMFYFDLFVVPFQVHDSFNTQLVF